MRGPCCHGTSPGRVCAHTFRRQVCKNIVLSGINVTVQDTAVVSEEDLAAQFFLTAADVGKNVCVQLLASVGLSMVVILVCRVPGQRAARSLPFIKQLNPLATAACVETPHVFPHIEKVPSLRWISGCKTRTSPGPGCAKRTLLRVGVEFAVDYRLIFH